MKEIEKEMPVKEMCRGGVPNTNEEIYFQKEGGRWMMLRGLVK